MAVKTLPLDLPGEGGGLEKNENRPKHSWVVGAEQGSNAPKPSAWAIWAWFLVRSSEAQGPNSPKPVKATRLKAVSYFWVGMLRGRFEPK